MEEESDDDDVVMKKVQKENRSHTFGINKKEEVEEESDDDYDIMEEVQKENPSHTFGINKIEEVEEESDDEMDNKTLEPMKQKMKSEPPLTQTQKSPSTQTQKSLNERPKIPPVKPSKSQTMTLDDSFTVCAFDTKEEKTQLKSLFDEISREKTVSYKEDCDSNDDFQERICVDPFSNMFSLKVHSKDVKRFDELFSDKCRLP